VLSVRLPPLPRHPGVLAGQILRLVHINESRSDKDETSYGKEEKNEKNRYIKYHPEIIVEVVSESTQVTDYVDKYIDYTKIPSLQYYMIVEPETVLITVYERTETNEWVTRKYTQLKDNVQLEKMNVSFTLQDVLVFPCRVNEYF